MTTLKNILAYLMQHYPPELSHHFSNARLTKMVYLADWRHAILHNGRQITDINWYFDNFGPFDRAVQDEIAAHPELFIAEPTTNSFGNHKLQFSLLDPLYQPDLDQEVKDALDHVIKTTSQKSWAEFIKLVYSTYPVFNATRYNYLNLPDQAREYALYLKIPQLA